MKSVNMNEGSRADKDRWFEPQPLTLDKGLNPKLNFV